MAKQIAWSSRAQDDRKQILNYWKLRNKSSSYSRKLNQLFKVAAKLIAEHPNIGKQTDTANVRVKIIRDYLMIYEETDIRITILTIWDTRQDPSGNILL
jgi:plasmid stabilization system protein ParE